MTAAHSPSRAGVHQRPRASFSASGTRCSRLSVHLCELAVVRARARWHVWSAARSLPRVHACAVSAVDMLATGRTTTTLERFKRDPDVRVLLLPIRSGGNGLNLMEATHVFLVEPLLSNGLEAQAVGAPPPQCTSVWSYGAVLPVPYALRALVSHVCAMISGRVHRLGQTQPTFVHRFVMRDTVEEAVVALASRRAQGDEAAASSAQGERVVLRRDDLAALFP